MSETIYEWFTRLMFGSGGVQSPASKTSPREMKYKKNVKKTLFFYYSKTNAERATFYTHNIVSLQDPQSDYIYDISVKYALHIFNRCVLSQITTIQSHMFWQWISILRIHC